MTDGARALRKAWRTWLQYRRAAGTSRGGDTEKRRLKAASHAHGGEYKRRRRNDPRKEVAQYIAGSKRVGLRFGLPAAGV
eukprot:5542334-Pleurochrysis_carterae.AAC.1